MDWPGAGRLLHGRAPAPGSSQTALAFPERTAGRHPHLFFRGLLKLSLTLRPAELLAHLTWTLSRGSSPASYPAEPLVSYQGIPTTPWVGPSPTGDLRHRGARPFRLTAEGLYSRVDYDYTSKEFTPSSGIHSYQAKHAVSQWEFPLLVKYRMRAYRLYPFVAGGASVRYSRDYTIGGLLGGEFDPFFPVTNAFSGGRSARYTVAGPTFAAGVGFGASRVRPSLEVRFTHWAQQPIREGGFTSFTAFGPNQSLHSTQNQAQLLVGLMF